MTTTPAALPLVRVVRLIEYLGSESAMPKQIENSINGIHKPHYGMQVTTVTVETPTEEMNALLAAATPDTRNDRSYDRPVPGSPDEIEELKILGEKWLLALGYRHDNVDGWRGPDGGKVAGPYEHMRALLVVLIRQTDKEYQSQRAAAEVSHG